MTTGESRSRLPLLPYPRRVDLASEGTVKAEGPERLVTEPGLAPEGYRISIDPVDGVSIAARDERGFFYGRTTLDQLRSVFGAEDGRLPAGTIEDSPDLAVRGVMLDVSRTKVPTLETLLDLVDRLASWKINHIQLYMEHTFAYADHEEVWAGADPYTAQDMARLREHCAGRQVELVPNQNTLGHMERWLIHERYAPLGIERGVVTSPFGMKMPASTLDPTNPGSLPLVRGLLEELSGVVPGTRFHVGLDEPWQLSAERRTEWSQWVSSLRACRELDGREMLVWGDFLATHPELLAALPDSVTVCEWGYESNHPFSQRAENLAGAGLAFWTCPGTSSWMSVLGRATNAVDNCRSAAVSALGAGASGLLVTDWGDFGHLQHLPVSDHGLAACAAFSWCMEANRGLDAAAIGDLLSLHSFGDGSLRMGEALSVLGDVYTMLPEVPNMSGLVASIYLPQIPVGEALTPGVTVSDFEAIEAKLDDAQEATAAATPTSLHGRLAAPELENSIRLALLACHDAIERLRSGSAGRLEDIAPRARAELAGTLGDITTEHRSLWLR
ncbi:MAG: family 20 glycosylhydrolase, partial [Acidimicrobiales bacterium]